MIYDLAIIGAGPAGYVAAERAGHKGMSVIIFDKRELGGVCLNEGCIPTKTLLYSAKIYDSAKNAKKYGILIPEAKMDFPAVMKRKDKVVKKLVGGVAAKMKNFNVEVIKSEAVIKGQNKGIIEIESNGKQFESKNILVCTGSEAFVPPIKGIENVEALTNREILKLTKLPASINIIGGGVIGLEFASFFSSAEVKVNVFEMMPEVLPGMDAEFSSMLRNELEKRGVNFYLNAKVIELKQNQVIFEKDNEINTVDGEKLLVCVGRKVNVEGLGLENIGVEFSPKGIKIDDKCRTNLTNVYAAGDVTGFSLLAHTASREAEVAVNNMNGEKDRMRYNAVPGVVYTNPELSSVGLTEEEANKKEIDYEVLKLPMAYAGRFIVENEGGSGLVKILIGKKYGEILGVHMIGNPSSEMIYGASMAIEMEMRVKDIKEIIFPHPTVSEIFKETVFSK